MVGTKCRDCCHADLFGTNVPHDCGGQEWWWVGGETWDGGEVGMVVVAGFVVAGICQPAMPEVTRDSPAKLAGGDHVSGEGVCWLNVA